MTEVALKSPKRNKNFWEILNNNQLKILALIAMTVDHVGYQFFSNVDAFRYIGRLAFPIFAFMIAEGCKYTRNRKKYLGIIFAEALICQAVYFVAERSLYMNIFVTFTLSIAVIFAVDFALKEKSLKSYVTFAVSVMFLLFVTLCLPQKLVGFEIDYGLIGVLTPLAVYLSKNKWVKLLSLFVMMLLLGVETGGYQYFGLLAVLLLIFYNGKRGKKQIKYFFYAYYPLHLAVIYLISLV